MIISLEKKILSGILFLLISCQSPWSALPSGLTFKTMFNTDKENKFTNPVWFEEMPGEKNVYLVVEKVSDEEKNAHAYILEEKSGVWSKTIFVTLKVESFLSSPSDERGFLGFAFHPNYKANGKYYVNFIAMRRSGQSGDTTLIEERVADESRRKDSGASPRRLLALYQPYQNHNGGCILFAPDGTLLIGTGDGGSSGDPKDNGQDKSKLLGKILRINVDKQDSGLPYGIPSDNPFVNETGSLKEIWAYGMRNPWRFSVNKSLDSLWVGDVGQNKFEEIDLVQKGKNYGWNIQEGFSCFNDKDRSNPLPNCNKTGLEQPIVHISRDSASSITGGYVYRGDKNSALYGVYIFGDYVSKRIWGLTQKDGKALEYQQIGLSPDNISSINEDKAGNLYICGYSKGIIYQITHKDLGTTKLRKKEAESKNKSLGSLILNWNAFGWLSDAGNDVVGRRKTEAID